MGYFLLRNIYYRLIPFDIQINMKRQLAYKIITIFSPILFLIILEIVLRVGNYGFNTHLFETDEDSRFWVMNREISQKYFTESQNATIGNQDAFFKKKPKGTLRFFILGESSSLGFPYMHNGSFARMLKYKLQFQFPQYNFEIINLSLTAINSYTLVDFSNQLVDYEPDGVLIYAGHNEYYGALGVASSSLLANNPRMVEMMLSFRNLKLIQAITRLANSFNSQKSPSPNQDLTLMERMAAHHQIPYQSALYKAGVEQFNYNIGNILQRLNNLNIPVFIGTLASSLKGQKPLCKDTVDSLYNAAREYGLGELSYAQSSYKEAQQHYFRAKEYDALRFRAPDVFNKIIRSYCELFKNVHLVDVEGKLAANSQNGILGNELMLEHVHPNLAGQRLIADAYLDALITNFSKFKGYSRGNIAIDLAKDYPVTAFDSIYGDLTIWKLKQQWPFNELPADLHYEKESFEYKTAIQFFYRKINWGEAMQRLNNHYILTNNYDNALRIVEQMCLELPHEQIFLRQATSLCIRLGQKEKATYYLKLAGNDR